MLRVLLVAACAIGAFAAKDYTGYKVLTLIPPTNDDSSIEFLRSLESEFDVWGESGSLGPSADIMIPGRAEGPLRSKLEQMGFTIRTKIADVQSLIDQQIKSTDGFNYLDYNTLDEIQQWMDDFTAENPDLVAMEMIGNTYEGREIYKLRISSNLSDSQKPIFFMIGGTHAREWITPATMINVAKHLVDTHDLPDSLLKHMEFNIVPVFNQDGYEYTWTNDRMWRKTRSPNEGSPCTGTDPNRNWDAQWGSKYTRLEGGVTDYMQQHVTVYAEAQLTKHKTWEAGGSSNLPCSDVYMGSKAASEIEISSMQDHVYAIRDRVKVFMDVHAFYQYWMYPYGYSEVLPADDEELITAVTVRAFDLQLYQRLEDTTIVLGARHYALINCKTHPLTPGNGASLFTVCGEHYCNLTHPCVKKREASQAAVDAIFATHGKSYENGPIATVIYVASGSSADWGYDVAGIKHSYALELRDEGEYGFLLPASQIQPAYEEFFAGCAAVVDYLDANGGL